MSNQELVKYVKKARESGQPPNQIRENLLKAGWKLEDVNVALNSDANKASSWTRVSADAALDKAPKWLVIVFKFCGASLVIAITVVFSVDMSLLAETQPKFLFSSGALMQYGFLITLLIIAFGLWKLKKWVIPILGLNLICRILFLFIYDLELDLLSLGLLDIVLLIFGYYYQKYFTDSYTSRKAYAAYGLSIVGLVLIFSSLYISTVKGISDKKEINDYIDSPAFSLLINDQKFIEIFRVIIQDKTGRNLSYEQASELINAPEFRSEVKEMPEVLEIIRIFLESRILNGGAGDGNMNGALKENLKSSKFEEGEIIKPLFANQPHYYKKEDGIYRFNVIDEGRLVSYPEKIFNFNSEDYYIDYFELSRDDRYLAYYIVPFTFKEGNENKKPILRLRDMKSSHEFDIVIGTENTWNNYQVFDLKFSPDNKTLLFTNDSINVLDLNSKNIQQYEKKPDCETCFYRIRDINSNGSYAVIVLGSEPEDIFIFDIKKGQFIGAPIKTSFLAHAGPGDINTIIGFIGNDLLLAYQHQWSDSGRDDSKIDSLIIYTISGEKIKEITSIGSIARGFDPYFSFDSKFTPNKVYFMVGSLIRGSEDTFSRKLSLFELDLSNFIFKESLEKIPLVVLTRVEENKDLDYLSDQTFLWFTNNLIENPVLIDEGEELRYYPDLPYLK